MGTKLLAYCFAAGASAAFTVGPAFAHDAQPAAGLSAGVKPEAEVVEVDVRESGGRMLFSPDRLELARGATVRFVVHNRGALDHEFTIGTKAANAAHARMMAKMPDMTHHDANTISMKPGATQTLTWRFAKPGTFEFACLIPGHYQAGMHGAVSVR